MEEKEIGLRKKINLLDATLFVMGSVLGSGIFMTSGHMISYIGKENLMLMIWFIGGLFTLAGGLCMAHLGIKYPQAGGPYVYLKEAYGEWAGFLFGWVFFWVIECGGIAALSAGFTSHFLNLLKKIDSPLFIINLTRIGEIKLMESQVIAILPIVFLSLVNHYGIKIGIFVQNLSMVIRIGLIAVFLSLGFIVLSQREAISLSGIESNPLPLGFSGVFLAMLAALWTFDGWYAANCAAEEMKNPAKDLPKAIIIGISGITIIYLAMNSFYVFALKAEEMAGVERVGELAAKVVFGEKIWPWVTAGIAITIFGCLSATIIYGPRVYFAMARDGLFFQGLAKIDPRTRVPAKAIWVQALWSSTLCLTGGFQALYEYVVLSLLIFFAAIGGAVFKIERDAKNKTANGWKTNLIKVIASLFILSCVAIYISSVIWKTKETILGAAIIITGWPAFIFWQRKAKNKLKIE